MGSDFTTLASTITFPPSRFMQNVQSNGRIPVLLALSGLLLAIVALLFPGLAPPPGRLSNAVWNLLHAPGFFCITLGCSVVLRRFFRYRVRALVSALIGCAFAGGTEWLQDSLGRSGSLVDLGLDAVGIGIAAFWLGFRERWGRREWIGIFLSFLVFAAVYFIPVAKAMAVEKRYAQHFPEIGRFDTEDSLVVWKPQRSATVELKQKPSCLRVRIGEGTYGGVSYQSGAQDWSAYDVVDIEFQNPGEPFYLGIRIDDVRVKKRRPRSWFSDSAMIASGESTVEVRLARSGPGVPEDFDFSKVIRLALFTGEETEPREFDLCGVELR